MEQVTGGTIVLGLYSHLNGVRLREARLKPERPDLVEILVLNCNLEKCDLRQMSWSHFRNCRLIDCREPETGRPEDAGGSTIETTEPVGFRAIY